jgi:hypothetical protein
LVEVQADDEELTEVRSEAYQPPSYVPPGSGGPQRKTWPWVVGILIVLVLALVGFTVAAAVFVPRMMKKANESAAANKNSNSSSSANDNTSANENVEVPANENSNTTNTNSDEPATSVAPPTDKEIVLAQLKDLEHEWTVANINADKKKLGQILADDYVSAGANGKMIGKAEYIRSIQRDTNIKSWDFEDLRLTLRGDRATLVGKVRFQVQAGEQVFDFVDRFVWRDGRWQATGSEVNQVRE